MAIGEPSPEVRRLAQELKAAVQESVDAAWWRLRLVDQQPGEDPVDPSIVRTVKDGLQRHDKAMTLLSELVEAL
jgi:hypothetical protein